MIESMTPGTALAVEKHMKTVFAFLFVVAAVSAYGGEISDLDSYLYNLHDGYETLQFPDIEPENPIQRYRNSVIQAHDEVFISYLRAGVGYLYHNFTHYVAGRKMASDWASDEAGRYVELFSYNEDNLIETIQTNRNGTVRFEYNYDSAGRLREIEVRRDGPERDESSISIEHRGSTTTVDGPAYTLVFESDVLTNFVDKRPFDPGITLEYRFRYQNGLVRTIESFERTDGVVERSYTYQYDEHGERTMEIRADGTVARREEPIYDSEGRLVARQLIRDGQVADTTSYTYRDNSIYVDGQALFGKTSPDRRPSRAPLPSSRCRVARRTRFPDPALCRFPRRGNPHYGDFRGDLSFVMQHELTY